MAKTAKNTICLWYDKDAEAAARFYAETFPNSAVGAVHRAPSDYPSGKKGDVLTVEFTVFGVPCLGLNGGPAFKHNEAFSFQIATDDQQETDRYWNAIVGNGGQESACGWCKDKWGISWQITPRVLTEAMAAGGDEAKRAFDAMMGMKKIDVAAITGGAARLTFRHKSFHGSPCLRGSKTWRACGSCSVVDPAATRWKCISAAKSTFGGPQRSRHLLLCITWPDRHSRGLQDPSICARGHWQQHRNRTAPGARPVAGRAFPGRWLRVAAGFAQQPARLPSHCHR